MRGDPDRALGDGDAELPPHLPRHPGIVLCRTGPATLVEPAEDEQVRVLQAGFKEAPDRQPGMESECRPDDDPGSECSEECRVVAAGERRKFAGGVDQLVAEARCTLARGLGPEPGAAFLGSARGETFGR